MSDLSITIHYTPGARGDFLASLLLDSWMPDGLRLNTAWIKKSKYHKVHWINDPAKDLKYTKIRIDDNGVIDNIMQISYNHFNKNTIPNPLDSYVDHFYQFTKDYIATNRQEVAHDNYDYFLDFSILSDIEFLEDFYLRLRSQPIDETFLRLIKENIDNQKLWTENNDLKKLSLLIDFENKFNLFKFIKNFSFDEFLSGDPKEFLKLRNYSITPFDL